MTYSCYLFFCVQNKDYSSKRNRFRLKCFGNLSKILNNTPRIMILIPNTEKEVARIIHATVLNGKIDKDAKEIHLILKCQWKTLENLRQNDFFLYGVTVVLYHSHGLFLLIFSFCDH